MEQRYYYHYSSIYHVNTRRIIFGQNHRNSRFHYFFHQIISSSAFILNLPEAIEEVVVEVAVTNGSCVFHLWQRLRSIPLLTLYVCICMAEWRSPVALSCLKKKKRWRSAGEAGGRSKGQSGAHVGATMAQSFTIYTRQTDNNAVRSLLEFLSAMRLCFFFVSEED